MSVYKPDARSLNQSKQLSLVGINIANINVKYIVVIFSASVI